MYDLRIKQKQPKNTIKTKNNVCNEEEKKTKKKMFKCFQLCVIKTKKITEMH